MVKSLERKGLLSRIPGKARTLRVEVASAMLPTSDFGSRRAVQPAGRERSTPAVDAAVAAAIAVLDQVRASLLVEVDRDSAARWLDSIATHLARALVKVAVAPEAAAEAARLIQAEIARWVPEKQGIRVERRHWVRRR